MKGTILGNCGTQIAHTGAGSCPTAERKTMALIVTSYDAVYPLDPVAFNAALAGNVTVDGNQRMFPIKGIVSAPRSGGEINAPELGTYGGPTPNGVTAMNTLFQVDAGDCLFKELSKFNSRKVRVFRVDDEGFIFGTVVTKGDEDKFAGFEAKVFANSTEDTGDAAFALQLGVYYSANYNKEKQNKHGFELENDLPEGLQGLRLVAGPTAATAKVFTTCGGVDVTEDHTWTADMFKNAAGTSPTTIDTTTTPGYITFTPAGSYKVASASVLAAADIIGFEGVDELVSLA